MTMTRERQGGSEEGGRGIKINVEVVLSDVISNLVGQTAWIKPNLC